ncbi:MAG: ABC transporter permease subunit, partial [Nitrospinales bacterium]
VTFVGDERRVHPRLEASKPLQVRDDDRPITRLAHTQNDSEKIIAVPVDFNRVHLIFIEERRTLMGGKKVSITRKDMVPPVQGKITTLVIDERGDSLFIGTTSGQILRGNLSAEPVAFETLAATSNADIAVTMLGFLLGDRTLIVGDSSGGVTSWLLLRDENNNLKLRKNHIFLPHDRPVKFFSASQRHKGFLTGDDSGVVRIHFGTTGETQMTLQQDLSSSILKGAYFSPKSDGMLSVDASGKIYNWAVDNPHPETTIKSLFSKTWYEGYAEPEYVWQSTGGTDDFEPKFSLVPLIFGTLKGTFYALLFAGPLALLGAFYHSQFMHPKIRAWVKPFIEIMAALPSVVLGFLAGLWLAPVLEKVLPGFIFFPFVVVLFVLVAVIVWDLSPLGLRKICKEGYEIFGFILIVLAGVTVAFYLSGKFESAFLQGDYRLWLNSVLGVSYDQRNAVVVGLAMGFAVIPMIFTISEDALSNVPKHLTASSLALGATPWQTALYVVLPTASPGIFSALMIGFGRAVGETMIVLMATGNTPVMEWNIFNGFRALSANIAVELPEAPEGGTLFRVLFLAAFLLFLMTFTVNTLAEWIRLRLRERYQTL